MDTNNHGPIVEIVPSGRLRIGRWQPGTVGSDQTFVRKCDGKAPVNATFEL